MVLLLEIFKPRKNYKVKNIFQKITIKEIPDFDFEGYYWYSNERRPKRVLGGKIDQSIFSDLPFVIEANFFSKKENVSIQVKNIDGDYYILQFNLSSIQDHHLIDKQDYIAHDLVDIKKYKMMEAWEERSDELLEGMKTLVPSWTAFVGFIND